MNIHDLMAANIVRDALEAKPRNGNPAGPAPARVVSLAPEAPKDTPEGREASAALAQEAQTRIAAHQHAILAELLMQRVERGEIDTINQEALDADGRLDCFNEPDGSVRFDLHGKPLIQFWPPTCAFDEDGMNVQLPYRVAL
jgi:hypothetical protein